MSWRLVEWRAHIAGEESTPDVDDAACPTPASTGVTARSTLVSLSGYTASVRFSTSRCAMLTKIGSPKDVGAGQMRVFDVAGTNVNVASANGDLYAFDDTCTHTGCSLAEGKLDGTTVTCSCHGSQFDVTSGAVIRGPARRPVRSRLVQIRGDDL